MIAGARGQPTRSLAASLRARRRDDSRELGSLHQPTTPRGSNSRRSRWAAPRRPADLRVMSRAAELLGNADRWTRTEIDDCTKLSGSYTLYCAVEGIARRNRQKARVPWARVR